MPQVIPLVLAAAAYLAGPTGGLILFGGALKISYAAIIGTVVMLATTVAIGMLTKPRRPVAQGLSEDRKQLVRGSIEPGQVIYGRAKVSGAIIYAASSGANQRFLHLVVVLACHRVSSIGQVWINGTLIELSDLDAAGMVTRSDHPMRGRVRIKRYTGTQTAADPDLVAESPDGWGADHVLTDQAYLYIRLEYDQERMAGLQEIQAYVEGRLVLDPRTSTTAFSFNSALCVLDYLRSDFGLACADDEIDMPSFIAAANLSDEAVPLNAGGTITQPRYTCDGAFKLERTAQDLMAALLSSCAGALVYVQGRYRLHGGAYSAPVATITEDDFAGPIEVTPRPARQDLFNAVRVTFVDPARDWLAVEAPLVFNPDFDAEDGGRIFRDIELPFTINVIAAQRLGRIMLLSERASTIRIRAPLKYSAIRFCAWNTIAITHADFGWTAKPFRIVGPFTYDPTEGTVMVGLKEANPSDFTWVFEMATTPDFPDTTLVNPLAIPTPAAPTLTASAVLNADGQTVPAIAVTWTAVNNPFVTFMDVEWRPAAGAWQTVPVPAGTTRADLWPLISGTTYEVRLRARTQLAAGEVSPSASLAAVADTTAPAAPEGLSATAAVRGVVLAWTANTEADLDRYRISDRAVGGSTWTTIAEVYGTRYVRADQTPGVAREYSLTAIDRSGNESLRSVVVTGTAKAVETADIGTDAVTTHVAQSSVAGWTGNGSWQTILSFSFSTASARVGNVDVLLRHGYSASALHELRLTVNGTVILLDGGTVINDYPAAGTTLSLSAGTHTVLLEWRGGSSAVQLTRAMVRFFLRER